MRCPLLSASARTALVLGAFALLSSGMLTEARAQNTGFQLNRYEPTAAGEWSFRVDHPWYSSIRYFAAGVTLNYAHNPLLGRRITSTGEVLEKQPVIAHQLTGHIDLAGSFLDRILIAASIPVTFLERGEPYATTGIAPAASPYVSDPRLGFLVRLFGQPYGNAISMSIGGNIWIPLGRFVSSTPPQGVDQVRGLIKVVLGGLTRRFMWSATAGALLRQSAQLGTASDPSGSSAGHELQIGAAVGYADMERGFSIGPEVALSTALSGQAFQQNATNLEVLLGFNYNIARYVNIGLAGGIGALRQAGTPDGRALLRIAYAPMSNLPQRDRDGDGVPDKQDACPDEHQGEIPEIGQPGCPQRDSDEDGVVDGDDFCPSIPAGRNADPKRRGCPAGDKDGDGVFDHEDLCPDQKPGDHSDPARRGCPAGDKDGDGVFDHEDQCPEQHAGDRRDPKRPGCPSLDKDGDGVVDGEDECVDVPAGPNPNPNKKGCPTLDRDQDFIPDATDACPDKAGVPDADPRKNGCPSKLVEVRIGQIVIKQQIFFALGKDTIQPQSFPLLKAVAETLILLPQIKKVRVEGHTDDIGAPANNLDLSRRRAQSVMRWLVDHSVEPERLVAEGYGDTRPIADNKNLKLKTKNRRVDFIILDPPQPQAAPGSESAPLPPPVSSPAKAPALPKKAGKPGAKPVIKRPAKPAAAAPK